MKTPTAIGSVMFLIVDVLFPDMGFLDRIFPPGSMKLTLPKTSFVAGEAVRGQALLSTKKPVHAREFKVTVFATKQVRKSGYGTRDNEDYTETVTIFESSQSFGGEKDYSNEAHDFGISIPKGVFGAGMPDLEGTIGNAIEAAGNFLKDMDKNSIKWYVEAKLDIPGGRDISKKVRIFVS